MKSYTCALLAMVAMAGWAAEPTSLHERSPVPLAQPLTVTGVGAWLTADDLARRTVSFYLTVDSHGDGWTLGRGEVCLTDGEARWPTTTALFAADAGNAGRHDSLQPLELTFPLPPRLDARRDLRLSLAGGIYAWRGGPDSDRFALSLWRGPRAVARASIDRMGRFAVVSAAGSTGDITSYEYAVTGRPVQRSTSPNWTGRVGPDGKLEGRLTIVCRDGGRYSTTFSARADAVSTALPDELLVGVCLYPEETMADADIAAAEAAGKTEWEGPYRRERHRPDFYLEQALREELGNLIVYWPEVRKTAGWSEADECARVRDLADRGVYSMTIYQHTSRDQAQRLHEAGRGRWFLGNNLGEFASYLYQGRSSAEACRVPQRGDLAECRDWFVNTYMRRGADDYHATYDHILSTSGSALSAYELDGGVDVMASELYAVGAENLAYATSEMRGAARRWQPARWGGWLAHEWQTCDIPYQAPEKMALLRAGLYQQYLMGSSLIVLESGSQTTQAGFYTAESGKRNFGNAEPPPTAYRAEMRDFYRYVRQHPRAPGLPATHLALARGHCDSFVGTFMDWLPVWSQFDSAKANPDWLYGTPERAWVAAQEVCFPRPSGAVGRFDNRWLAGSPLGQIDICPVDELTLASDLAPYRALAYSGWNSMTPGIAANLRAYVEAGGELLLALPHLSTRLDREYRGYTADDLLGHGRLESLLPVTVTGWRQTVGTAGSVPAGEPVAKVSLGAGTQVLTRDAAGEPVVVRAKVGQGSVTLMLTWEYPGKATLAKLYQALLAQMAVDRRGEVFISEPGEPLPRDDGPNTSCVSYAEYGDTVYLLNVDLTRRHRVTLHRGPKATDMELGPGEFRALAPR